jgi:predicted HTH transcriptional regulator
MADKAEELVYLKYFKGIISYRGLQRIENYPIPRTAFREAVLNAIVHRDYSTGNPIHIHIYPNKVLIYNDGRLPENWTEADLFAPHTSKPYNPLIAAAFFRSGQIEAWGRGVEKISAACREWGKPEPFYRIRSNEVMIGFDTEVGEFGENVGGLGENDDSIVEKPDSIGENDGSIVEKPNSIGENDYSIVEKPDNIGENDGSIVEKPNSIVENDGSIVENDDSIVEKPNSIVENDDSIGERPNSIVEKPNSIVESLAVNTIWAKILEIMSNNPKTTAMAIAKEIGMAPRNVQVHIKSLKTMGMIERVGPAKGGYWVVKKA